jgi:hypothetical protein
MKRLSSILSVLALVFGTVSLSAQSHVKIEGNSLTVDGKPFTLLAGELHNSTTGSVDGMAGVFRRMADKHYRGKSGDPQFDKDYFKSSTGSTTTDGKQRTGQQKTWGQQQQQTRRTTTTREGVTIIDERSQSTQRKIFAEDEGEDVEFDES